MRDLGVKRQWICDVCGWTESTNPQVKEKKCTKCSPGEKVYVQRRERDALQKQSSAKEVPR